jgi:hypothetical protein
MKSFKNPGLKPKTQVETQKPGLKPEAMTEPRNTLTPGFNPGHTLMILPVL